MLEIVISELNHGENIFSISCEITFYVFLEFSTSTSNLYVLSQLKGMFTEDDVLHSEQHVGSGVWEIGEKSYLCVSQRNWNE